MLGYAIRALVSHYKSSLAWRAVQSERGTLIVCDSPEVSKSSRVRQLSEYYVPKLTSRVKTELQRLSVYALSCHLLAMCVACK